MMMKYVMLVSLAFLALLVQAHAIRLEQGFMSLSNQKHKEDKNKLIISEVEAGGAGANSAGVKEVVQCRDKEHCSSSGRNRKRMVTTVPSTTTTTTTATATVEKTEKIGEHIVDSKGYYSKEQPKLKKEDFSVETSPVSEHRDAGADQYPDILDIAGMDYSSAKRKPPIHN